MHVHVVGRRLLQEDEISLIALGPPAEDVSREGGQVLTRSGPGWFRVQPHCPDPPRFRLPAGIASCCCRLVLYISDSRTWCDDLPHLLPSRAVQRSVSRGTCCPFRRAVHRSDLGPAHSDNSGWQKLLHPDTCRCDAFARPAPPLDRLTLEIYLWPSHWAPIARPDLDRGKPAESKWTQPSVPSLGPPV